MNERRARWLLVVVLVGQLLLLSSQASDPEGERSRLEAAVLWVASPFARLVSVSYDGIAGLAYGLTLRRVLIDENRRLQSEVEELRRERARLFGLEREVDRLSEAFGYAPLARGPLVVADIVYADHASWLQTVILHVGDAEVGPNQAVLSAAGLVGRVVVVPRPYAKVQLITDRAASVGGMVERTRRQGVVRGSGSGLLMFDFVPLQADVRVGDLVVTAGIDGIYPRGIPIGSITSVEPGNELFHRIELAPAVDFGQLDQVYVVDREPVPETAREALPDARP